jgi:deoxyribonuclease V
MDNLHPWDLSPPEARTLQENLSKQVRIQHLPLDFELLGSADLSYILPSGLLIAVMMTFRWPELELLESTHVVEPIRFPYVPGLLSFREIPPLLNAFLQLSNRPNVLLCDGQGIAHPRKIGIASHLGLWLKIPTVGCAKKRLCGKYDPFELRRGNSSPLYYKDEILGNVFCTRDGIKPVFISPGHLCDLESATEIVRRCLGRYRIPEPQRQAHNLASKVKMEFLARGPSELLPD